MIIKASNDFNFIQNWRHEQSDEIFDKVRLLDKSKNEIQLNLKDFLGTFQGVIKTICMTLLSC